VPKLIGDDNIRFGVLALDGAFAITPVIASGPSRKGRLRFSLECEEPQFIDEMHRSASEFVRKNRGKLEPRGKARPSFAVTFDAPRNNGSFGEMFPTLAFQLFLELREEFMGWQVGHHLARAVQTAQAKRGTAKLKLLRGRKR
jgi:hypothetical protein